MRQPRQLSHETLQAIVETIHQLLYGETNPEGETFFNPDKPWSGADLCQELGLLWERYDLVPTEPTDSES